MRGCAACSRQTIMQFKGSDADLLQIYQRAREDVIRYLAETGQLEQAA